MVERFDKLKIPKQVTRGQMIANDKIGGLTKKFKGSKIHLIGKAVEKIDERWLGGPGVNPNIVGVKIRGRVLAKPLAPAGLAKNIDMVSRGDKVQAKKERNSQN